MIEKPNPRSESRTKRSKKSSKSAKAEDSEPNGYKTPHESQEKSSLKG